MSGESGMVSAARFVARCVGCPEQPTASTSGQLELCVNNGCILRGLTTVCTYLVRQSSGKQALLGSTPELQAQVLEWLTWATVELTPLMDDKLLMLNQHLSSRTYLVGISITVADLVIYGLVHPAVVGFPSAQTLHYCSLLRWFDLIQNTADLAGFFQPRLILHKPRYVAPPPPPPPVPKAVPTTVAPSTASPGTDATEGGQVAWTAPLKEGAESAATSLVTADAVADGKSAKDAKGSKKVGQAKDAKASSKEAAYAAPAASGAEDEVTIDMLDCRVGRIVKIDKHPNADALYLEEIDVGEEKPRQVISGLRNFVAVEQMQDRIVVVVCNLKPAKMRDIMSYGMVLCASDDAHGKVEPVLVPDEVLIGERLFVEGYTGNPVEEINPKKKILERLFPDMKTNEVGTPMYKGKPFTTSKGPLRSSVPNGLVK